MTTPTQSTIGLHQRISALSLDDPDSIWNLEPSSANRYTFIITHDRLPNLDMDVNIRGRSHNVKTEFRGKTDNDELFHKKTERQFKETIQASINTKTERYLKSLDETVDTELSSSKRCEVEFQLSELERDFNLLWKFASEDILADEKRGPKWLDTLRKSVDCAGETAKDEVVKEMHVDFDEYWDIKVAEK